MRTIKLTEETRKDLLEKLLKRSPNCYGEYEGRVTEIVNTVRAEGDKALFDYTERFDRAKITVEMRWGRYLIGRSGGASFSSRRSAPALQGGSARRRGMRCRSIPG